MGGFPDTARKDRAEKPIRVGLIGYPVFLAGTIVVKFNLIDVTDGAGMLVRVPGGLFELILPIWLFTKGFVSHHVET